MHEVDKSLHLIHMFIIIILSSINCQRFEMACVCDIKFCLQRFQLASYPKCTLHEDYGKLLEESMLTDVTFIVGHVRDVNLFQCTILVTVICYLMYWLILPYSVVFCMCK